VTSPTPLAALRETIASRILEAVAGFRKKGQLDTSLCWPAEELERLAMYAIDAKNKQVMGIAVIERRIAGEQAGNDPVVPLCPSHQAVDAAMKREMAADFTGDIERRVTAMLRAAYAVDFAAVADAVKPFLRNDVIRHGSLSRGVGKEYAAHVERLRKLLTEAP